MSTWPDLNKFTKTQSSAKATFTMDCYYGFIFGKI